LNCPDGKSFNSRLGDAVTFSVDFRDIVMLISAHVSEIIEEKPIISKMFCFT
jgi:hypothetical protein